MSVNQEFCEAMAEELGIEDPQLACEAFAPADPVNDGSLVDELDVIDRSTDTLICGPKDNEYVLGLEGGADIPVPGLGELGKVRGDVSVTRSGFECERFPKY